MSGGEAAWEDAVVSAAVNIGVDGEAAFWQAGGKWKRWGSAAGRGWQGSLGNAPICRAEAGNKIRARSSLLRALFI